MPNVTDRSAQDAVLTETEGGTLPDWEIRALCERKILISKNFQTDNIKQACYELRASRIYYELPDGLRVELLPGATILVRPKQQVVVITEEVLELPSNVLGRVLTKGKLFSIGLLPVNTYADPGFNGRLGIVFCNVSNNYLQIKQGDPIAKIEFSRLEHAVERPYTGQHGYETGIWPIPTEMILTPEQIRDDHRIKGTTTEIARSYGPDIGTVIDRVYRFERIFLLATLVSVTVTVLLVSISELGGWKSTVLNVVLSVVANAVTAGLGWFATNLRRK